MIISVIFQILVTSIDMQKIIYRIILILLYFIATPSPSQAGESIINAVSFRPIPAATAIVVQPWDNSDENINTARLIEAQLRDLGYKISPQANLILSFETKSSLGKWSSSSRNTSVELKAEGSTSSGKDAEVRLNLFSSSKGGVLNPSKTPGENILSKVSLEITLDQQNGPRLWQGEAIAGVHQTDTASVARRLTPALLDHLGKTISGKTVNIP
tara:strand:- start:616 stop:1257 length:642 start_codon:yes stop_codon:yes gene_type:complete